MFKLKNMYTVFTQVIGAKGLANSANPDQTPQNAASDQGLDCLPVDNHVLDTTKGRIVLSLRANSLIFEYTIFSELRKTKFVSRNCIIFP